MPERPQTAAELLAEGVLVERLALYDRALERYRAAAEASQPAARAEALRRQSDVYRARCEWDRALERARESAYIAQSSGLTYFLTEALNAEAMIFAIRGELGHATTLLQRTLALATTAGMRGVALQNLGTVAAMQGEFAQADTLFEQSLDCFERERHSRGIAAAHINRGRAALDQGQPDRALRHLDRALVVAQQTQDLDLVAIATLNTAECYALDEDYRRAEDLASTALGYFTVAGNHWRRVECLRVFGDVRLRQRDRITAEHAYRAGLDLARAIGARLDERVLAARLESLAGQAN